MSSPPPYQLTNESVTVVWGGKSHTVQKGSPNYTALRKAIVEENWEAIPNNLTISKSLGDWAKGKFTVTGDQFFFDGRQLNSKFNRRIVDMATRGEDPEPLFKFWERLQKNPSFRSVEQLWDFLQHEGIPLTPDGCFLAYKSVRNDYKDHHSGMWDNSPGRVNEMPRNQISDDPKVACHDGFHVGALQYAETFKSGDGRLVVCKVDPENVVCVPYDSSQHKMRVCKYEVTGNHNGEFLPSTTFTEDTYEDEEEVEESEAEEIEPHEADGDTSETECDECGNGIPEDCYSEENHFHKPSCSLFRAKDKVTTEVEETEDGKTVVKMSLPMDSDQDLRSVLRPEKKPSKSPSKKSFAKLGKMRASELMDQSIDVLRKYAAKELKMVGASKIPGGKTPLVARILKMRK